MFIPVRGGMFIDKETLTDSNSVGAACNSFRSYGALAKQETASDYKHWAPTELTTPNYPHATFKLYLATESLLLLLPPEQLLVVRPNASP